MLKAIIFDFDGVIHNTLHDDHKVHNQTLEKISLEDMQKNVYEGNPRQYFQKFDKQTQNRFETAWEKHYKTLELEAHVRDFLEKIYLQYKLFIITSNTEKNIEHYLKNNQAEHFFSQTFGAETHISKIEKFKMLLKSYKLNSDECLFVTDSLGDILEANEVNIKTLAVDFGFHLPETLAKGNPYQIVSSFDQILEIINSHKNPIDNKHIYIGKGNLAGKGAYAARDFEKGEIVIQYKLIPLSQKEFQALPESEKMFTHVYKGQIYLYSEPERYVNHSKNPNTYQDHEIKADIALRKSKQGS